MTAKSKFRLDLIEQAHRALDALAEHAPEELTKAQAIQKLIAPIRATQAKGYSLAPIGKVLSESGIPISAGALRLYVGGAKVAARRGKKAPGDRVLTLGDGFPVPGHTLRDWIQRAQRRAGLEATGNVHILRHTFCSHLAMRGAAPKAIQDLAGHQHLSTTMRYMHLSPSERERAIGLLNRRGAHGTMAAHDGAARASS